MTIFTKLLTVIGLGMLLLVSSVPGFAAPPITFPVSSNGNTLTIATSSTIPVTVGIQSLTPGFNFPGCTITNGYCYVVVSDTLSQNITLAGPATQPTLRVCKIANNGTTSNCQSTVLANRFGYIVNYLGFSVSSCPINSITGQLSSCTRITDSVRDPTFALGAYAIAINPAGTFAYLTTVSYNGGNPNAILICPINPDGLLGACATSAQGFNIPGYLTFNAEGTIAYVANTKTGSNAVSICSLNATDGSFSVCNNFTDASFNNPTGIALNSAENRAYVTNFGVAGSGVTVSKCSVNETSGSLSDCRAMPDPTFQGATGIAINNNDTFAYITNYNVTNGVTVSRCPINRKTGLFGSCTALSDTSFSGPIGIALNSTGTKAYVTEYNTSQVSVCPIKIDGSFDTCSASNPSTSLNTPIGIALF